MDISAEMYNSTVYPGFDIEGILSQRNPTFNITEPPIDSLKTVVQRCLTLYLCLVLAVGIFGNLGSIIIYFRKAYKAQTSSCSEYVLGICISNLFSLGCMLANVIYGLTGTSISTDFGCKMVIFLSYMGNFLVTWFILAFTFERLLIVRKPLRRATITKRHARCVIITVALAGFVYHFWLLIAYHTELYMYGNYICVIISKFLEFARIFKIVNSCVVFIFPAGSIFVMNLWILVVLYSANRMQREGRTLLRKSSPEGRKRSTKDPFDQNVHHTTLYACPSNQPISGRDAAIAKGLIFASCIYLFLNCPHYIWTFVRDIHLFNDISTMYLVDEVLQMLLVTQYATHCYIYSSLSLRKSAIRVRISSVTGFVSKLLATRTVPLSPSSRCPRTLPNRKLHRFGLSERAYSHCYQQRERSMTPEPLSHQFPLIRTDDVIETMESELGIT